jgi:hypothetical protein
MKECFKCHRTLPLSEFYKHPMMGDGHLGKCKHCAKGDVRKNRAEKRDQYLEYDRMRSKSPERQKAISASSNSDPLKVWARKATHSALNRGLLERKPCEVCGGEKSDAHHEDYRFPLQVRWLCRQHHMEAHHPREEIA